MKKALIFVCLFIVLCVPAFAVNNIEFASGDYSYTRPDGVIFSLVPSGDYQLYYFLRYSNSDSTQIEITAVAVGTGKSVTWSRSNSNYSYDEALTSSLGYSSTQSSNLYYKAVINASTDGSFTPSLIPFAYGTSNADIVAAFDGYISNPGGGSGGGSTPGPSSSFRVPAGNVLYFQVDSEQDVVLNANMPKLSSIFGGTKPWGDSGIMYGPAASLPTSSTSFPILSQDAVSWSVKQPTNVLGQSRVGTASKRCIVGQWYALYLPSIFGLLDTTSDLDSSRYLPGASVDISGSFSQIKVYPLESQYNWSGADFVTGSADEYETYYDGSVDENGSVTFTNQDGVVSTPPNGGSNQFDVDTNPLNLVETIKNILSNILKEIESLFSFGYDAIRSLVGIMSDFVSVFQGLYSWLPQPVYTALISAVTIAIVIGVFKVFL